MHIPEGIGNVDAKWKRVEGDLRIVRSRWQWKKPAFERERTTFDPTTNSWAEDGNAAGADPVFNSRLPRPLRVGSLDDAKASEDTLLQLALSPFVSELKKIEADPESPLSKSMVGLVDIVKGMTGGHSDRFNKISEQVAAGFQTVFPRLAVRLDVNMEVPSLKLDALLKQGSGLRIADGKTETTLHQQGTGARRALFWSMIQVHNQLSRAIELAEQKRKAIDKVEKSLQAEEKKAKPDGKKIDQLKEGLAALKQEKADKLEKDDPAFPGYLLLIDEPENALHPLAARAAQKHLYRLADDPDWQVMLTTHSPYFINPLEDHTTIVRLEREAEDETAPVTPRTYRSDSVGFDLPTKKRLQALQQLDTALAEIFFGTYPILVEGDTEHAAFLAAVLETDHKLAEKITVVRSRGKALLEPLVRIMKHFQISFGIIHDADPPFKKDGSANGMWTENGKIRAAVDECRKTGMTVRHRVSVPDFERLMGGEELGKDKPLAAYERISGDDALKAKVQEILSGLHESAQHDPFEMGTKDFIELLREKVIHWATENGQDKNPRFSGKKA